MAVTAQRFWYTKQFILNGDISIASDTLKLILIRPGFTYNNSMVTYGGISALEIPNSPRYATGGVEVTGKSVTTSAAGKAELWINGFSFPYLTAEVGGAIIYANKTFSGIVDPLLYHCDFGSALVFVSTLFEFTWPSPILQW